MLSELIQADTDIFMTLNGSHTPFWDSFMAAVTSRFIWIPFYIMLVWFVRRKCNIRQTVLCVAMIALAVALSDQICASWLRPMIGRLRPANLENPISDMVQIVNGYRGGAFGFPSCHGANSAAVAMFLILFFRNRYATLGLLSWSLLLGYSRIYLGVHYPGDILCGMIIGSVFAMFTYWLFGGCQKSPLKC